MNWNDVITDPSLQDLPFKIELNGMGEIVMSPASNSHGYFQGRIFSLLEAETKKEEISGLVLVECSIDTDDGTKVADVAWMSQAFHQAHEFATPYPVSPELCVEVLSPSNYDPEMTAKRKLYVDQGAKEVWLCDGQGVMHFFGRDGALTQSSLFPEFPQKISI